MNRLYRFYNMDKSAYGEPFTICDECHPDQKIPDNCALVRLADKSIQICIKCGEKDD